MFLIVGCQTPKIKKQLLCDISFQFNRCRCGCYDLNKLKAVKPQKCNIEREEWVWDEEIEYCEGVSGFFPEAIAIDIIPKIKEIKRYIKNKCGI